MNGFKTDLTKKILGLNPHIVIEPNSFLIDDEYISKLKNEFQDIQINKSFSGEGIIINNDNAKGVILKGINKDEKKSIEFIKKNITSGNVKAFKKNQVFLGTELAYNLNLKEGDKINLMSSAFVATPLGSLPKQESFKIAGTFTTGFIEFDQNIVFLGIEDALSIFDKDEKDKNLEIYLNDPLKANLIKNKIEKINPNYFIYTWSDLNKSFFSALKVERNVMFIILTLIVIVADIPIIKPTKKKIFIIDLFKTPIDFKIAISRVLFLTNIVKPEIILKAATIIISDKIINITFLSTFRAENNELFISDHE